MACSRRGLAFILGAQAQECERILGKPAVDLFRKERDWMLREIPASFTQRVYLTSLGADSSSTMYGLPRSSTA